MWPDNETDRDLLNFDGVAQTVAEFVVQANDEPISVGISGAWGVGKSSLIKLTKSAIIESQDKLTPGRSIIFVDFNAWLYQGYDDARAALLDVIATKLEEEARRKKSGVDHALDFLSRVRWLRLAGALAMPAAQVAMGLPPVGLLGGAIDLWKSASDGAITSEHFENAEQLGKDALAGAGKLVEPKKAYSPPEEIDALRNSFEETLREIGVTLVVLIDDLDRCLPERAISTLEAIRLFLFLKRTAFVIAADDDMIRYAVKKHFGDLENDDLVTNYFDKLIQIPIKVPSLGTQEVRAYLFMLFIDNSGLEQERKDSIRESVALQLRKTWEGKRVDRAFITSLGELPGTLIAQLDTAERIAPLMTTSRRIAGNPRLIKRFLNALSIRMTIAKAQGVNVNEAALVKLLLFERLADARQYARLASAVNGAEDGKPAFLSPWERAAAAGEEIPLDPEWDDDFIIEWLKLPPALSDADLRGELYVGREQAPVITATDRLSSEAARLLVAILDYPDNARAVKPELEKLQRPELVTIFDRIMETAQRERSWGAPPILNAILVLAEVDPEFGTRFSGFLLQRPANQIEADIVPKLSGLNWSKDVFDQWRTADDIIQPVKQAIDRLGSRGNIAK